MGGVVGDGPAILAGRPEGTAHEGALVAELLWNAPHIDASPAQTPLSPFDRFTKIQYLCNYTHIYVSIFYCC